jgi:hypothetical protein
MISCFILLSLLELSTCSLWGSKESENSVVLTNVNPLDPTDYGVDVTSPIHYGIDRKTYFGKRYEALMQGCYKWASKVACDATESARLEMNREQPSNQINYTEIGFKKIRAPKAVWDPIIAFYEKNKDQQKPESWPKGNTYVNNWDNETTMVSFEDKNLREGWSVKK